MKSGLLIALVVAVLFVLTGLANAHDHALPETCEEWCSDDQCRCHDACEKNGMPAFPQPGNCKGDCNDVKDECQAQCKVPKFSLRGTRP